MGKTWQRREFKRGLKRRDRGRAEMRRRRNRFAGANSFPAGQESNQNFFIHESKSINHININHERQTA